MQHCDQPRSASGSPFLQGPVPGALLVWFGLFEAWLGWIGLGWLGWVVVFVALPSDVFRPDIKHVDSLPQILELDSRSR